MTDLQTSLIIIGGVILVGVISYNKWQEHKTRKSLERAFSTDHDDVLMYGDDAVEPELSDPDEERNLPSGYADDRREPALEQIPDVRQTSPQQPAPAKQRVKKQASGRAPSSFSEAAAQFTQPDEPFISLDTLPNSHADYLTESLGGEDLDTDLSHVAASLDDPAILAASQSAAPAELPIDELIDCLIPIALEAPVRAEKILPGIQNLRYVGNKAVNFIARTTTSKWESVTPGHSYNAMLVGVQLANRNSAINELDYSELIMRLREFTDSIGGEPEVPDMMNVIKTAKSLHQFIVDHDVQLGINVRSNGAPWNVTTLLVALTRQGFDRRTDGHLVMQDGEGEVLFSMSTNVTGSAETTDRLTLLLDVPRVSQSREGYAAMVACARSLAMRLGGTVVDDSDHLLSDAALSDIAEQVSAFYSAMEASQVVAGSKRAIRLFG